MLIAHNVRCKNSAKSAFDRTPYVFCRCVDLPIGRVSDCARVLPDTNRKGHAHTYSLSEDNRVWTRVYGVQVARLQRFGEGTDFRPCGTWERGLTLSRLALAKRAAGACERG